MYLKKKKYTGRHRQRARVPTDYSKGQTEEHKRTNSQSTTNG
uniref:Uncharacterized protein n=1 Tax=Anguilla anguilla TaxID=7936 RepID=A0A0E9RB44_ANGAN